MPRPLTANQIAAISATALRPALFVEANFVSGPVYCWTGLGQYTWNSITWQGLGSLCSVSTVEEGATVDAKGITIAVSGIDLTLLADVLGEFQVGLPCLVYLGLFDTGFNLIDTPITAFSGRMDQPTIDVDGTTATISIACESRLVEMNVAVDRRYTNEDQQLDYPGDTGLQFVSSIQEATIYWGRTPSKINQ